MEEMRYFVLDYRRGPNWIEGEPVDRQPLRGHLGHLAQLYASGKLVMAGPFRETQGGMAVVQTDTLEEATLLAATDPGVEDGVLGVDVHEWQPVVWESVLGGKLEFANDGAEVRFGPSHPDSLGSDG